MSKSLPISSSLFIYFFIPTSIVYVYMIVRVAGLSTFLLLVWATNPFNTVPLSQDEDTETLYMFFKYKCLFRIRYR